MGVNFYKNVDNNTRTSLNGLLAGDGSLIYSPTPDESRALIKVQRRLEFTFDGGGTILEDGETTPINAVDFNGTILSWIVLVVDGVDAIVDVWKTPLGETPTSLDSITDEEYIVGNGQDTGLVTGWSDTSVNIGDVIVANLQTAGNATYVKLILVCEEV